MKKSENQNSTTPLIIGSLLTVVIFGVGFISAFLPACYETTQGITNCPTKWFYLKQSTPNELGDALAGFAGALAFVWIVVTVWIQSQELSAQRAELAETRKELELARIAQEKQLAVMETQAKIFEDEQSQRAEIRSKELLEQLLQDLRNIVAYDNTYWEYRENPDALFGGRPVSRRLFTRPSKTDLSIDDFFWEQERFANQTYSEILDDIDSDKLDENSFPEKKNLTDALKTINRILIVEGKLGEDQQERLRKIRLQELKLHLENYSNLPVWHPDDIEAP